MSQECGQIQETGHPGYAPGDLLKLYIYGYLNRIRSSRRLEAETHRNASSARSGPNSKTRRPGIS